MIVTVFHSMSHSTSVAGADNENGATLARWCKCMPGKDNRKEVWQWIGVRGEIVGQSQAERAPGEGERERAAGCLVTQI